MKEYQVPRIRDAAFTGALWLIALSMLLVLSPTAADSLVSRVLTAGFSLAGALFLLKIGLDTSAADEAELAYVKEPVRRVRREGKAA